MHEHKIISALFLAIISFFICIGNVNASGNKDRYVEKAGNFSISIPESWEVVNVKGLKYKILRGQFNNNFSPSINFTDDAFDGQFNEYIESVKKKLDDMLGENIEYILSSEFVTSKGLAGRIIVFTTFQQKMLVQQSIFYFPDKNNKILLITCTNLANDFERYNKLFYETVKNFEWIK